MTITRPVPALRGTPAWHDVSLPTQLFNGSSMSVIEQAVTFFSNRKYYTATFQRFYDRSKPQGERVTYAVDCVRDATQRRSDKLSDALANSDWLSTFKRNVADAAMNVGSK